MLVFNRVIGSLRLSYMIAHYHCDDDDDYDDDDDDDNKHNE